MGYKTILVHCDADRTTPGRLAIAAGLASRFEAHLAGLYVQPQAGMPSFIESPAALDAYRAYEAKRKMRASAAAAAFKQAVNGNGLSAEWRTAEGAVDEQVAIQARYADLIVLGQHDRDSEFETVPADLPETVALSSGRPVLVVPYIGAERPPGGTVLLCWNAEREAARAACDAMPLLRGAREVIVLTIDARPSATGHGQEPGADVATWLARHGVKVTVVRDTAADSDVGNVILSRAADHSADLVVMGVYGHSRLRELVLGGASRTLLASMTVPVLMAH